MSQQRRKPLTETPLSSSESMALYEVRIKDKQCSIGKFSAIEGWKLIHKITKASGPLIGSFAKGDYAGGIMGLLEVIDEDEMIRLIRQLSSVCLIDGRKVSEADYVNYGLIFELCGEVIKHNFSDFFSPMIDLAKDFGQRAPAPT